MSDKKKRNLIIILCVLAVVIAIAAVVFAPFGKKVSNGTGSPETTEATEITQIITETTTLPETTEASTESTETTFVVPYSTDPVINPNKNYTLFIDKSVFEATENVDGETVLTAKNNSNVKMTITPVREMSYKQCCRATEAKHQKLSGEKLDIENTNTVYRSQTGDGADDIITTVYCVDDNKGGCIVIDCRTPVGATEYINTIEIMLSMFKVL